MTSELFDIGSGKTSGLNLSEAFWRNVAKDGKLAQLIDAIQTRGHKTRKIISQNQPGITDRRTDTTHKPAENFLVGVIEGTEKETDVLPTYGLIQTEVASN